jgi:glycosyltransferase involved in cell wall biosynthesis
MPSTRSLMLATAQRCELISELLGLPRSFDRQFVRNVLERFSPQHQGPDAEPAWNRLGYVLSQAFHCRMPAADLGATLRSRFVRGGIAHLHAAVVDATAAWASPQATAALVPVDPKTLLVDVTYTAQVNFTSGIQRVVRSLAQHLPEVTPDTVFVRWESRTGCFTPLDQHELDSLRAPEPRHARGSGEPAVAGPAARLLERIGRAATWPGKRLERTIRRSRRKATDRRYTTASAFLWGQPILVPELVGEEPHLDALRLLSAADLVRSTMVFYDAIPIRHAEYFLPPTHTVYLRSLSLTQDVHAISCISDTVRDNLEHLLAVMPRHRRPNVAVHYPGADFSAPGFAPPRDDERPLVLSVGTVEPRKNQLRILRAMIAAQEAGARFTGVFAGNAGWLNGIFRDELAAAVAAGYSLELHEHVDDGALRGLYARSAFTVYCSLDEGFGLPIIESLRHGKPCITSDRGSMREIAERTGGCLLVNPEDTADLAAALAGLLADREMLSGLEREAERAGWPSWRQYARQLAGFASRPAAAFGRAESRAA